jgi:hypothetical protein
MRYLKYLALLGIFMVAASSAQAQVRVGIGIGPAYVGPPPACVYGYYGYYPYACAPYGYYEPDYFVSGVFIGAGPWFHGFYGRGGYGYYGRGYYRRNFDRRERFRDDFRDGREGRFRGRDREFREGHDRDFRGGRGRESHGGHGGESHGGGRR